MPRYDLRYKSHGVTTGFESFDDRDAFRVILLAQHHSEPAELWKDGSYITTLVRCADSGCWQLYREANVGDPSLAQLTHSAMPAAPDANAPREPAWARAMTGNARATGRQPQPSVPTASARKPMSAVPA